MTATDKPKVVLVLGAGAGVDLGMPLGSGLQDTIYGYSRGSRDADARGGPDIYDAKIATALGNLWRGKDPTPYVEALRQIHNGMYFTASIDDYLDRHKSNQIVNTCGKILIARAILYHERDSYLHFRPDNMFNTFDFGKVRNSWLIRFWQMLARGTATEDIVSSLDHITFINFNYDRCLEHFLVEAYRGLDNLSLEKAHDLVSKVNILHPYGIVGPLGQRGRNGVDFGDEGADLINRAKGIKTYTEQVADEKLVAKIYDAIQSAHTLIFLGFHFHRQNVELLKPNGVCRIERVYATVLGMSLQDREIVTKQIGRMMRLDLPHKAVNVELVDGDCAELFRRFEKTLDL